jgi:hypothetical protein
MKKRMVLAGIISQAALAAMLVFGLVLTGCHNPSGSGSRETFYTVKFDTQGGSAVPDQSVVSGGKVIQPANPAKDGVTFGGWYSEPAYTNLWNFQAAVTGNMALYAKWTVSGQEQTAAQQNEAALQAAGQITLTAPTAGGGSVEVVITIGTNDTVNLTIGGASTGYLYVITGNTIILTGAGENSGDAEIGYVINDNGTLTITGGLDQVKDAGLAPGPVTSYTNTNLTKPADNDGLLTITISGSAARTLYPAQTGFQSYKASFTHGSLSHIDEPFDPGATTMTVSLTTDAAPWAVTVTAFTGMGGRGTASASGTASVIMDGTAKTVDITLAPITGGTGTFSYSISFPTTVSSAKLTITTDTGGAVTGGDIMASSGNISAGTLDGTLSLDAGYYFMNILLVKDTISAGVNEVVHIYPGLTTAANNTFTDDVFFTDPHGISLSQTGTYTFPAATEGYGAQAALSVTITNTGSQATGALTVALAGTNSTSFTLSTMAISSIAVDGTDTFTVVPKTGLAAGTYTATVTVSGGNGITANFDIGFTVDTNIVHAVTPSISGQPAASAIYTQNTAATALTVTANASDGGTLSYQWYKNTSNSTTGGIAIGTNSTSYTPSTAIGETAYYYVVVTNTNTGVNGTPTATVTSSVAAVTVNPATYGIDLDVIGTHTFTATTLGYTAQGAKSVTVTNTGNQATGLLTVYLTGDNPGSFTLSTPSINSIAVGGTDSFTVVPKTGLAIGTYAAKVTVSGSNGITASFNVSFTVSPIAVTGVTLNKPSLSLVVGATETLTATIAPLNATNQGKTWFSDAEAVATVSPTGLVTAVAPGTATITVTTVDGSHTASATVTVPVPGSLEISIGFNFGTITITESNGSNVISRGADTSKPLSIALSATGYIGVQWYVDGILKTGATGDSITLTAAAYDIRNHSVTFTGSKDGIPYSQLIPFRVVQ